MLVSFQARTRLFLCRCGCDTLYPLLSLDICHHCVAPVLQVCYLISIAVLLQELKLG
jgi:hypothetical protein